MLSSLAIEERKAQQFFILFFDLPFFIWFLVLVSWFLANGITIGPYAEDFSLREKRPLWTQCIHYEHKEKRRKIV